jgi:hypothetical protein
MTDAVKARCSTGRTSDAIMSAFDTLDSARARLVDLGAGTFAHVSGSLARHVERTEALLRQWGSRPALCAAGLYHAVYGTAGIDGALVSLADRGTIAEAIGVEAERIAYLYGACDREAFHPRIGTADQLQFVDRFIGSAYPIAHSDLCDFCELTIANELELALASRAFRDKHRNALSALFERMRGIASAEALSSYEDAFGMSARVAR